MTIDKNRTYKPKDILVADGYPGVTPGRGRLSQAAKDRIAELVSEGYRVEGYAIAENPKSESQKATVKKVTVTSEKTIAEPFIRYDIGETYAVDANGKEWSMKECCNTCRVSLVGHVCDNPTILGNIPVTVKYR